MKILFLCVGNSARSQIDEGLAKHMLGKEHNVRSAGSQPSGFIHKNAILALEEMGIDISNNTSKSIENLDNNFLNDLDFVITLCAEEICPVLPSNAQSLHWKLEDPANINFTDVEPITPFLKTRDDLYKLLKKFTINYLIL